MVILQLVEISGFASIIIFNAITYSRKTVISNAHTSTIRSLVVLKNDDLVSGSEDGKIKIWNSNTGALINTLTDITTSSAVFDLLLLKTDELASSYQSGDLRVWNSNSGNMTCKITISSGYTPFLAILYSNKLVVGSGDDSITILS